MNPISRRQFLINATRLAGLSLLPLPGLAKDLTKAGLGLTSPTSPSGLPTPYQLQTPHFALQMDLTNATYEDRFTQLIHQGYRPIWFQGVDNAGSGATFSTIWVRDGLTNWYEWHNMDTAGYQTKFDTYASQGYLPISVSGYSDNGALRFGAVWLYAPSIGYAGIHNATSSAYQTFVNNNIAAGLTPLVVDGYTVNGADYYISIWTNQAIGAWEARHAITGAAYQTLFNTFSPTERVTEVSGYNVGGTPYFTAIMASRNGVGFVGRHNTLPLDYFNQAHDSAKIDQQPNVVDGYDNGSARNFAGAWIQKTRAWSATGPAVPSLAAFDIAMQTYMQARNIPSGALAVVKDSRLVLARGYRWDFDNVDPVQPTSLFRIASLTKAITSAAILRLVQDGRLSLSDKLINRVTLPAPMDARTNNITILELLQHLGGWDRDTTAFDPMFADQTIASALGVPLPISKANIITYMTTKRNLDFTPGTKYVYSNYGYLLLGRVIESITGLSYAAAVKTLVFDPLSITRIVQGATELENRQADEVAYYTLSVPDLGANVRQVGAPVNAMPSYGGFNIENMDSHGAWIASAVDLARFTTLFDATGTYPVLNAGSIATVFGVPAVGINPDGAWYGCGWSVRSAGGGLNTWHTGSLDGTTTEFVRRFDGVNYVMLFNQRADPSGLDYGAIDGLMYGAADSIASWPGGDMFFTYKLPTPGHKYSYVNLPLVEK
jgi:CubicO group peptidase (beta-lactamase class C family)